MIIKPITTEKAIKLIEIDNTILFEVSPQDTKENIKKYFEKMFSVKVEKINIMRRGSRKIAYINLNKRNLAIDIATKLGMI